MKSGMMRWKLHPLKCSGLPDLPTPFSPARNIGAMLPRQAMLPRMVAWRHSGTPRRRAAHWRAASTGYCAVRGQSGAGAWAVPVGGHTCAQAAEVLGRLRNDVSEEFEFDATRGDIPDDHVEENDWVGHGCAASGTGGMWWSRGTSSGK